MSKSWEDLRSEGWVRHESDGKFIFYERPNTKKKKCKRDLNAKEKAKIGDILFPGKKRRGPQLGVPQIDVGETINDPHNDDVLMDDVPEPSESVTVCCEVCLFFVLWDL